MQSAAFPGADPGDIRGNSTEFAHFYRQFLARDRGKTHGERSAEL